MIRFTYKGLLCGTVFIAAFAAVASAKTFNIPGGDLATALDCLYEARRACGDRIRQGR